MRIIYTNLKEEDCGTKRSMRQVQVDFSRDSNRGDFLTDRKLPDKQGRENHVVLDRGLVARMGRPIDQSPAGDGKEMNDALLRGIANEDCLPGRSVAVSLAAFYIRKFLETEMQAARQREERSRINVII